jgi:hypothetical protein
VRSMVSLSVLSVGWVGAMVELVFVILVLNIIFLQEATKMSWILTCSEQRTYALCVLVWFPDSSYWVQEL